MKVFIEAAAGSREKGVYDESSLERKGERVAIAAYPWPYGFIVGTRSADGDCLDCYVITTRELREGETVECEPAGLLEMLEDGEDDSKVLARLPGEGFPLPADLRDRLRDFITTVFSVYPEARVEVGRLLPREAAEDLILRAAAGGPEARERDGG